MSQNLTPPSSTSSSSQLPSTPSTLLLDGQGNVGRRLDALAHQGSEAVQRLTHEAEDFAHRSVEQIRHQGKAWGERGAVQIRQHPLRAVAVAAGAGVLLALVARMLMRR
jgi:ElaB/YqjD/DUF883 family membrane-anchored ribosome-binding protein